MEYSDIEIYNKIINDFVFRHGDLVTDKRTGRTHKVDHVLVHGYDLFVVTYENERIHTEFCIKE